jgi:hypothetical protein
MYPALPRRRNEGGLTSDASSEFRFARIGMMVRRSSPATSRAGTLDGAGIGLKPPRFLQPGDEVRIEIDRIGTLANAIA